MLLAASLPLGAQAYSIPGVTQGGPSAEKKPTSRDPRYVPPFLPDYLRRKIDPAAGLILASPEGIDLEAFVQARARKAAERRKRTGRYEGRDFSETADTPADRERFESEVLRQFGVNLPEPMTVLDPPYRETAGRRFQVVFLLALPITSVFSYGIVTAAKGTFGRKSGLNQGETIGVAVGGIVSAGIIAWRDLRLWRRAEHERLRKQEQSHLGTPDAYAREWAAVGAATLPAWEDEPRRNGSRQGDELFLPVRFQVARF